MDTVFINMEREVFQGDILDIGFDNFGIVYSICKDMEDEVAIDYVNDLNQHLRQSDEKYDSCVMFFSLKDILLNHNKRKLIRYIDNQLKDEGNLYIWDIDKKYNEVVQTKIRVALPDNKIREIEIKEKSILKDTSMASTIKLLEPYFDIIEAKNSNKIFYIKGKKKGTKG